MPFNLPLLLLAGIFYLSLVSGGVFLFGSDGSANDLVRLGIAASSIALIFWAAPSRTAIRLAFKFVLIFSCPLLLSAYAAKNIDYSLSKIDSAILGTVLSFLLAAAAIRRFGFVEFLKGLIAIGLLILSLTVVYKFLFGFSDRSVRFFLNGPIVFGWLMGLMGVASISIWRVVGLRKYAFFGFLFFLAVVWTQSKGPLVAFIAVSGFVFLVQMEMKQRLATFFLLAVFFALGSQFKLSEVFSNTRLAAIERLLKNSTSDVDQGSVEVRVRMYRDSLSLADQNPVAGIGVGNWQAYTNSDYLYPHNQHLEILVELGLFYFLLYLSFVFYSLVIAGGVLRSMLVFLLIAASFSGDLSYTRYVFLFSLLAIYLQAKDYESATISRAGS